MAVDRFGAVSRPDLTLEEWIDIIGRRVWIHEIIGLFARVTWMERQADYEEGGGPDGSDAEWINVETLRQVMPLVTVGPNLFSVGDADD